MCQDCGCGVVEGFTIHTQTEHEHYHPHGHHHHHEHHSADGSQRTIDIRQSILGKNDRLAQRNRDYFRSKRVFALNILSSPGSGKTTFIERTLTDLNQLNWGCRAGVIVGDLETDNDARRIGKTGAPAVQITTGNLCHLEAEMIFNASEKLNLDALDLLIIENVGNLVCPAAYDLGENLRVVLFAVTEGEDKPLKYPAMFKSADVIVLNKIDIAPAVGFEREEAIANLTRVAPRAKLVEVSAKTGAGMNLWHDLLQQHLQNPKLSLRTAETAEGV